MIRCWDRCHTKSPTRLSRLDLPKSPGISTASGVVGSLGTPCVSLRFPHSGLLSDELY